LKISFSAPDPYWKFHAGSENGPAKTSKAEEKLSSKITG
jgi:hypothetical protein